MNLLQQIQEDAINNEISVTTLVRKCKLLAARLGHRPLEEWVEFELNGYPEDTPLPPYRAPVPLQLKGNFINAAWKAEGIVVGPEALPEEVRDPPPEKTMREAIGDIEQLASHPKGVVAFGMPASLRPHVQVFELMECYALWGEVPTMVFKNIVEQVRNRVLTFALEIEKENPGAGEAELGSHPVDAEKISSMTSTIFYGGTNTVAVGSPGAVQNVSVVTSGDLPSLLEHLRKLGVTNEDLDELNEAIKGDEGSRGEDGFGERVKSWLGKMAVKAATGTWQLGAMTGANVLGLAIAKYYGLT